MKAVNADNLHSIHSSGSIQLRDVAFTLKNNPLSFDGFNGDITLKDADIGYRIITGGNFLRHDVIKYYDYEVVGGATPNADMAHDFGFFVGNHPRDLGAEIGELREVLDRAARPAASHVTA